jgi:glycerol-3-phosphate cytidylyltransferase
MKRVITYGTFDLLHHGHINLLRRARAKGDSLIVGLSTDQFNELKGKKSYFPFEKRKLILESVRYVDLVIEESCWDQKINDIIAHNVSLFVIGDDWKGRFDNLKEVCEVEYLPRTAEVSTSQIKKDILNGKFVF